MERVGSRLRLLRSQAGLSQRELARRLTVDPATVARWETGETKIDADELPRMAQAIGVTPALFFEAKPARLPEPEERLAAAVAERVERRLEEKLDQKLAPLYEALERRPTGPRRPGRALRAEEVEKLGTEYLARELLHALAELPEEELGRLLKEALEVHREER